jgi:glycosyltransferase involved in cell wall biosynthesis
MMQAVDAGVSVIIPCFNGEQFIGDALKSVLSQTFKELEIIVVDDGSSDGSRDVIKQFQGDSRVIYIAHEENKGIAAARNTGIRRAQGEFIAFLDQDDVWWQKKIAKQVHVMTEDVQKNIGLVSSDIEIIQDIKGKRNTWVETAPAGVGDKSRIELLRALFMRNFVRIVTATVRRECFEKVGLLNETIRGGSDDYELCFRIARNYRFAHINEPLVTRRLHGKNFSDIEKFYPDNLKILGEVLESVPELADLKNRRLSGLNLQRGNSYMLDGNLDDAKSAYKTSWRYERSNMKAFIGMLLSYCGPLGRSIATSWFTRGMS